MENKFVYIKVRRDVAEHIKNLYEDLNNMHLYSDLQVKKENKLIIKAINTALKNNGKI